ncbi:hypothetical protein J4433_02505 [Candidatus Pacearchaeota archaeon]|nr:hypothetical protein [Candidatus Pacearchaeota archaeon]
MRILLSKTSRMRLFGYLKQKNKVETLSQLSQKLGIPFSTLDKWLHNPKRYVPREIIPSNLNLEIIDERPDNWGQIKGGQETYRVLVQKYGIKEIKKRQLKGAMISALIREEKAKNNLRIDIEDPLFLEFYGALLGDGWLSSLSYAYKKRIWLIGISGHSELDKAYLLFLKEIIKKLFNKKVAIKYKNDCKGMEILCYHKQLILFMNKELEFPIGKKVNLRIKDSLANDWNKIKYVIRGIFDTDGSFYLDKTPSGNPYPIITISMKSPFLLAQLNKQLLANNFKVRFREYELILKGSIQVTKWMREIGSSNPKHFLKYQSWLKNNVPVAQLG